MKLPFLFNSKNSVQAKSSWQWPSCHQPRTLSFRKDDNSLFETINSTSYLDAIIEAETPESWFSNSSESASFSTAASDESGGHDPVESVIRGLRSDRLFSEPGETSSILEGAKKPITGSPFKESVVLSLESHDPYVDFRKSMEEMVEAQGLKDWEGLEELLCWYLRANGKSNHGYIIVAFIDLLVGLAASISSTNNCIPSCSNCSQSHSHSPSSSENNSSTTNLCSSSLSEAVQKEIIIIKNDKDDDDASSSLLDV